MNDGWPMVPYRMAQRIATGPDAMAEAEALRRVQDRRDDWPYPHVYPPQKSMRRDPNGYTLCPAAGVQAQILAFEIPQGAFFYLTHLGLYFTGGTYSFGDFFFTVDLNVPLGAMIFQGVPLTDWQSIPFPLGNPEVGPTRLPRAEKFAPSDVLRAKVTNVNLAGGPPLTFGAWFGGWLLPSSDAPRSQQ
jgi:hypothetical protein